MDRTINLKDKIEDLREQLNKLIVSNQYNLKNSDIIELSQKLDDVLNLYEKAKK